MKEHFLKLILLALAFTSTRGNKSHIFVMPASGENDEVAAELISPRLISLQKELSRGNRAALETFRQEIAKQGTPLVEPIPGDNRYLHVTFLWQAKGETRNVVVRVSNTALLANADYFARAQMSRMVDTDLWYKTYRLRDDARFAYQLSPNDALTLLPSLKQEDWAKRQATYQADPLNPVHYTSINGDSSVVELPAAPPQPWIKRLPGVPEGKVEEHQFKSSILNNDRQVFVYTPPGYKPNGRPYRLLVTFDGGSYVNNLSLPVTLDNLSAKGRLPPVVAVMIGNASGARLRELWYHEPFNEFLAKELMPWVRRQYHVTSEPGWTIIAGSSLGGNAALFAAFKHPEIFGNAIAQSGGYMYPRTREKVFAPQPPGQLFENDFPETEWLTRQIAVSPKVPVRFYVEAGLFEDIDWRASFPSFAYPSLLLSARHLRDVLQAKGYQVYYNEYNGSHEPLNWRGTLAEALIVLIGQEKK